MLLEDKYLKMLLDYIDNLKSFITGRNEIIKGNGDKDSNKYIKIKNDNNFEKSSLTNKYYNYKYLYDYNTLITKEESKKN